MIELKLMLKTVFFPFFIPSGILMLLTIFTLVSIVKKKYQLAKILAGCTVFFYLVFTLDPVVEFLVYQYERQYQVFDEKKLTPEEKSEIKYVVVLAGGIAPGDDTPLISSIAPQTLPRLIEGIRLKRKLNIPKLVVSGRGYEKIAESTAMQKLAIDIGVPSVDIIVENESRNTFQHTKYLKKIIGKERFILVTSALHMPRAIAMFTNAGFDPIAAPTNHSVVGDYHFFRINQWHPDSGNLARLDKLFYELYGYIWALLTGKI